MSSSPPELGGLELQAAEGRAMLRLAPLPTQVERRRFALGYASTLILSDLLGLTLALATTLTVVGAGPADDAPAGVSAAVLTGGALLWLGLFAAYGLYGHRGMAAAGLDEVGRLFHALLAGTLVLLAAGQVLKDVADWAAIYGPLNLGLFATVAMITIPALRTAVRSRTAAGAPTRRVLIVGGGDAARMVARKLELHGSRGTEVVGFLCDDPRGESVLGHPDELARHIDELEIDCVVLASPGQARASLLEAVRTVRRPGVQLSIVPEYFQLFSSNALLEDVAGVPVVSLPPLRLSRGARIFKRSLDLVASSVGLLLLSPLLAVVAGVIKLDSRGPVLFRQVRHGRGGREFRICKFRTMVDGAEAHREALAHLNEMVDGGPLFKMHADPRITRVGAVLRKLSIDELPQLWNVLRGEMSLVGPRPFVVHESACITGWGERRLETTPGITGLWQILGRNDISFEEMLQLDYVYVTNWTPWWDIKILLKTIPAVIGGRGAY